MFTEDHGFWINEVLWSQEHIINHSWKEQSRIIDDHIKSSSPLRKCLIYWEENMRAATYCVQCTWHHWKDWLPQSYGHCFFCVCVVVVLGVWGAGRYKSISKLEKENSVSVAGEVDCPFGRFQTCLLAAGCVQQWPDCLRSLGALWTRPRCTNPALNVKVVRQAKWVVLQTPLFLQTSRAIHWLSWSSSVRIACVQTKSGDLTKEWWCQLSACSTTEEDSQPVALLRKIVALLRKIVLLGKIVHSTTGEDSTTEEDSQPVALLRKIVALLRKIVLLGKIVHSTTGEDSTTEEDSQPVALLRKIVALLRKIVLLGKIVHSTTGEDSTTEEDSQPVALLRKIVALLRKIVLLGKIVHSTTGEDSNTEEDSP